MLVLSRCPHQKLYIGNDIIITILDIRGQQVRIGVTAPRDISIDRSELRARKNAEKAMP